MEIGEESEPIEVPMPVHPDQIPAGTPAPEPAAPSRCPHRVRKPPTSRRPGSRCGPGGWTVPR